MSAAHTEGLLEADELYLRAGGADGAVIARVGMFRTEECIANGLRLAACWNACAGVSTMDLELAPGYASAIAGFHEQRSLVVEARNERDTARALLQAVLDENDAWRNSVLADTGMHLETSDLVERIRAFLKGGAA